MQLRPCSLCRRHVVIAEPACPFCGAQLASVSPRTPQLAGRLSRASVFAGATLASACYIGNPPPQYGPPPPPPPPDDQQHVQQHEPPPPPPDGGGFAKPPGTAATSVIRGVVTDGMGGPAPGVIVQAVGPNQKVVTARTDGRGAYELRELPAARYRLTFTGTSNHPRRGQPVERREVNLGVGDVQTVSVDIFSEPYVPDTGPCCKPYGAPPARRRVV